MLRSILLVPMMVRVERFRAPYPDGAGSAARACPHGNQPHFMRRLRASIAAARVHTQLPLPGSRSNAGQLNLPLQSADYHQTVAMLARGLTPE